MTDHTPCPQPGHKPDPAVRSGRAKILLVVGDGAEVLDTLVPLYRLGEEYQVVVAGPEKRAYHLVIHERSEGWDITEERPGYQLEADAAFRDIQAEDHIGLVLPGGRAPEYIRLNPRVLEIVREFAEAKKPIAAICHGPQILAAAGVLADRACSCYSAVSPEISAGGGTYVEPAGL